MRKNAKNGQKVNSLLRQLDKTRFLFPHKVAQRKRNLVAFFASQSSISGNSNIVNNNSKGAVPLFRCLNSGEIFKDNDFQGVEIKKWYCLAPKIENTTLECVFAGELTPAGFKIKPLSNTTSMHVCKSESVIKNAYSNEPCLVFYNFEGISEGPVQKAEIYDRGDRCIAFIESDSLEFWYDAGSHPRFINASVQDSLYFDGEIDHTITWIGDVNRNGKIEFVIEHAPMQSVEYYLQFIEKNEKDGKIILETKAYYTKNIPQHDE